jgi:alkyl hydroperoxide reductase subunit AhpC
MKRNGMYALDFHGPALVDGDVTYLHGRRYEAKIVALCFLPDVSRVSTKVIDRQAQRFEDIGVALLFVASGARPLHRMWIGRQNKPCTPVLADPCGRLHRSFGVDSASPSRRCHTFVIDGSGVLRLCVSHDFTERDLTLLLELIVSSQSHKKTWHADDIKRAAGRASCMS